MCETSLAKVRTITLLRSPFIPKRICNDMLSNNLMGESNENCSRSDCSVLHISTALTDATILVREGRNACLSKAGFYQQVVTASFEVSKILYCRCLSCSCWYSVGHHHHYLTEHQEQRQLTFCGQDFPELPCPKRETQGSTVLQCR